MTKPTNTNERLAESLADLEQLLESPVVPGETHDWLERIQDNMNSLSHFLATQTSVAHQQQFEEIVEQDAAQLPRVERMRKEDAEILEEITRLERILSKVKAKVGAALQDEQRDAAEFKKLLRPLTDSSLDLIIRIRTQENTLGTWYVEAFQRDRGVAD